jgi:hypothetical protein
MRAYVSLPSYFNQSICCLTPHHDLPQLLLVLVQVHLLLAHEEGLLLVLVVVL